MPNLFTYKGFTFFFYSDDHEPKHCHVKKGGGDLKIELNDIGGGTILPNLVMASKKHNFTQSDLNKILEFCRVYGAEMILKWDRFFIEGQPITCEHVNKIKKVGQKNSKQGRKKTD